MVTAEEFAFAQLIVLGSVDEQVLVFDDGRRGRIPDRDDEGVLHEVERTLTTANRRTACAIIDYHFLGVLKRR